jgi:type IV pilus assembly protein PilM
MATMDSGQMTSDSLDLLRPDSIVVDAPPERHVEEQTAPSSDTDTPQAKRKMPSLSMPKIDTGALKGAVPTLKVPRGSKTGGRSRNGSTLVGLDIQPGYVSAVQARVNGSILVQRAAGAPLPPDTVREGEVIDEQALAETLKEMFHDSRLDKRVRVGIANQRTVLRTLEMPPIPDGKELATAVRFQAEDQVPMPLDNAVLDYHALGVVETPAGPRMRVIVVAAQRDMVERLLSAVRAAGLRPEGVDLSAFALIRSLHRASEAEEEASRVLYLNVGGLTNMAIAEGTVCRFTRVVGGGLESMAAAIAERNKIALVQARDLLADVDLSESLVKVPDTPAEVPGDDAEAPSDLSEAPTLSQSEAQAQHEPEVPSVSKSQPRIDVRPVLTAGVREIAGEVRNSLDFHRSQGGGGEVSSIILSGPALQIVGFADALQGELGVPVVPQTVGLMVEAEANEIAAERLAVAAGLAVEEAPR